MECGRLLPLFPRTMLKCVLRTAVAPCPKPRQALRTPNAARKLKRRCEFSRGQFRAYGLAKRMECGRLLPLFPRTMLKCVLRTAVAPCPKAPGKPDALQTRRGNLSAGV